MEKSPHIFNTTPFLLPLFLIIILIAGVIFSFNRPLTRKTALNSSTPLSVDTSNIPLIDTFNSIPPEIIYTDTICIYDDGETAFWYYTYELNQIQDSLSCLHAYPPLHPDTTYNRNPKYYQIIGANGQTKTLNYDCEIGHDHYFMLYSYFLQLQNKCSNCKNVRKRLFKLYALINSMFHDVNGSGSYFGHQYWRISAYVEYDAYLYSTLQNSKYVLSYQGKKKFISALKDTLITRFESDVFYPIKEKESRLRSLHQQINQLNSLLTTQFYLEKTIAFVKSHYQYD